MAPRPRRTIIVLEAPHTSSQASVDDFRTSQKTTGPSSTLSPTQSISKPSTSSEDSTSRSNRKTRRPTRQATSSASKLPLKSSIHSRPTSFRTITEYSSTTTIYTPGFTTSTRVETQQPSVTTSGPPLRRIRGSTGEIPHPPAWFPFLIAALLAIMLALAVLFYLVNFPNTGQGIRRWCRQWRDWIAWKRMSRYGYEEVGGGEVELDSTYGHSTSTSSRVSGLGLTTSARSDKDVTVTAGFTTSANTPALHNTPTLYSRRRKLDKTSPESGTPAGLGIDLAGGKRLDLRQQKSFDETLLRPDIDKPLPNPPSSPALQGLQTAREFSSTPSNGLQLSTPDGRKRPTDLESGLLKPPRHRYRPTTADATVDSAPPSPGLWVLEMVGGSVEYAAEKMSKFMHDQVHGDPEEGLLLPVRDCERENMIGEAY